MAKRRLRQLAIAKILELEDTPGIKKNWDC